MRTKNREKYLLKRPIINRWKRLSITLICLVVLLTFSSEVTVHAQRAPWTIIYLDFDSHSEYGYPIGGGQYANLIVPWFDEITNPLGLQEITRNVIEDFALFDVEVTTVEPEGIEDGYYGQGQKLIRVVIGGEAVPSGYPYHVEGISTRPADRNTVFAFQFSSSHAFRSNKKIAQTVSHELAHAFSFSIASGLSHYTELDHHDPYPRQTPILGAVGTSTQRDVWFTHPNVLLGLEVGTDNQIWGLQDDIYVLNKALDLRRDDHSGMFNLATRLRQAASSNGNMVVQGEGIIEMSRGNHASICPPPPPGPVIGGPSWCLLNPQAFGLFNDIFIFDAGWGSGGQQILTIKVNTIDAPSQVDGAANVDTDLELWYLDPNTYRWEHLNNISKYKIESTGLGTQGGHRITTRSTGPGTYAVVVKSAGGYSDVGQYTVSVRGEDVREIEGLWHYRFLTERFYILLDKLERYELKDGLVSLIKVLNEEQMMFQPDDMDAETLAKTMKQALEQADVSDVFSPLFMGQAWAEVDKDTQAEIEARFVAAVKRLIER